MRRFVWSAVLLLSCLGLRAESLEALRAKATEKGFTLPKGCFVEGVMTGDYLSANMAANIQMAWNKMDLRMAYLTNYLQTEDGSLGLRVCFKDIYDNRVPRFARVRIDLSGCEIYKQSSPECYTVAGVEAGRVQVLSQGTAPVKRRHISELTDRDIFTYVTLEQVEFLSKEGAYTNVRELYVQSTWLNAFKKPADSDWFDEAGLYVKDNEGEAIFLPVNTICTWRRRGDRLPGGVGSVSGIVVADILPRSGFPGPMQLRIAGPQDVDIPVELASNYKTIAEWNWDRNYYYSLKCQSGEQKWLERERITGEPVAPDEGEGWLSVTMPSRMGLEKDYNTRCPQDGLTPGEGNRECAAIVWDTDVLQWKDPKAAIVVETSTAGFSGKGLTVDFTWLAGDGTIKNVSGFPELWQLAWSINGKSFLPVNKPFLLRPLAWSKDGPVTPEAAVGYTENTVLLPAFLLGKEKVWFRIFPVPGQQLDSKAVLNLRIGKMSIKALQ
ncbi:MAG: hypothetical protein IJR34_04610 [Bacteroidales bacterium]|nr:hypothetical protein [Bacteroidales bacterium]